MKIKQSPSRTIFQFFNMIFLTTSSILCLFPIIHILAVSFSSAHAASAGKVSLWPVDFTLASYKYVLENTSYWIAFGVTIKRIVLALPITMLLIILTAYPLSKGSRKFKGRQFYTYFFIIPMLFGGGLVPWYMTLKWYGMLGSIWSLVLPGAMPVFSAILLMNFYRDLPDEIEDAALIDGAGPLMALFKIYVPLSTPPLATIALFCIVGHWNSWFDGIILMDHPRKYPLQSYLQTVIINYDFKTISSKDLEIVKQISDRTSRAAQIFIGTFPILAVYPFLQKYFTKGIVLGSVKG